MPLSNAPNVSLLFIVGGDEADRLVQVDGKIRASGTTDLWRLAEPEPHHRLHVTRNFFRQGRLPELDGYKILFNMVTEPERNSRTLENMRKLLRGVRGRVINRPEGVLRSSREQVARKLDGIKALVVPPTLRIAPGKSNIAASMLGKAGLRSPIILREAGTHGGRIVGLFEAIETLVDAIDPAKDHLATQFVDFRSADGLYRKYRVFFIGGRRILRHMLVSDDWNVHAKDRTRFMAERPELVAEEKALFEADEPFSAEVNEVLAAVNDRMPLDFFGMDFGITPDGKVVLFEANATMSFFPFAGDPQFEYLHLAIDPARRAIRDLLGLQPLQAGQMLSKLESA
jgi:hypothetical protein